MQQWDRSRDGLVTYQEFEDYYKGACTFIDTYWLLKVVLDSYFCLLLSFMLLIVYVCVCVCVYVFVYVCVCVCVCVVGQQ